MALAVGTRLGPYEIQSALGAGGMGEVYKARDTRLDRVVAIKVLPAQLADDPQFRERFDREAKAISALDHPHICALHDVGEQDGTAYIVMQYVEGETLEQRLKKGALPIDLALQYAIQIADALDKAHRAGIVHRDLKPGNVMLTKTRAKLLDFGLAKTTAGVGPAAGLSMLPTTPPNLTMQGTILGTLQYMAPEQLEGRDVDTRTDIFAFGAVLYEMLTGAKAFEGQSHAGVIGAIMHSDPHPISSIQPATPPALEHLVSTCLAKNPDERRQTAHDVLLDLRWTAQRHADGTPSAPPKFSTKRREPFVWSVAVVALAAAALALGTALSNRRAATPRTVTKLDLVTPLSIEPVSLALSPDGSQLAFVATTDGVARVWIRSLAQGTSQALAGTDGGSYPFWSPDSRSLGFFANGKLKRIDLAGGAPYVLADAPYGRGGTWNENGVIVFAPTPPSALMRVSAAGGPAVPVTRFASGQHTHRWPQFLPDGRRFLFFVGLSAADINGVYVGSIDGAEPIRVVPANSAAVFAPPGWLLLVRDGVLVARRFDPTRAVLGGDPLPLAQDVDSNGSVLRGAFTVSVAGTLAYRTATNRQRRLIWVGRSGKELGQIGAPGRIVNPEIARNGSRAAFNLIENKTDVYVVDVNRGTPLRFTFGASYALLPLWSPDATRVVFVSTDERGVYNLFEKQASGAADEQPLFESSETKVPLDWSPDGRFLLYATVLPPKTRSELWVLPLGDDRKPFPIVQTPFDNFEGQLSPDGRWLAYVSNETNRNEVYVRRFPGSGGRWQVSVAGGDQPRWRPDGKELFYFAGDGRLMGAPIAAASAGQAFEAGIPVPLFRTHLAPGQVPEGGVTSRAQYAVSPDGRFLMNVMGEDTNGSPITIVLNWNAALTR